MGYKIIDNLLEEKDLIYIQDSFLYSKTCPWYFEDYTVAYETKDMDNPQFTHVLFTNVTDKPMWVHSGESIILPIMEKLNPKSLIRIKLNLQVPNSTNTINMFHVDNTFLVEREIKYSIGIFYLNTCDGYTILKNGTKIESVANRLLLLSGDTIHTGCAATKGRRVVINFNFINSETEELYSQPS